MSRLFSFPFIFYALTQTKYRISKLSSFAFFVVEMLQDVIRISQSSASETFFFVQYYLFIGQIDGPEFGLPPGILTEVFPFS